MQALEENDKYPVLMTSTSVTDFLEKLFQALANSADLDQLLQSNESNQGLSC